MNNKPKTSKNSGFTILESVVALCTVIIIMIVVTAGIKAVSRVYRQSLFYSESQILASTIDIALSDVLRYSSNVTYSSDEVTFDNINYGIENGSISINDGKIYLIASDETSKALLSDKTYSSMQITDLSMSYSDSVYTGNYTIISNLDSALTKTFNFAFRSIS